MTNLTLRKKLDKSHLYFLDCGTLQSRLRCLIMKRFASTFLAPLMHHLQPDSHYYLKPQLTKITKFLVMIRLAYDQVSDAFRKVKEAHMTTPGQRGLVASIIELVERYIVTVSAL